VTTTRKYTSSDRGRALLVQAVLCCLITSAVRRFKSAGQLRGSRLYCFQLRNCGSRPIRLILTAIGKPWPF